MYCVLAPDCGTPLLPLPWWHGSQSAQGCPRTGTGECGQVDGGGGCAGISSDVCPPAALGYLGVRCQARKTRSRKWEESGGSVVTLYPGLALQNLQVRCSADLHSHWTVPELPCLIGPSGPVVPLRANRSVFLPLWNNVDYSGEEWRDIPPTEDEDREEEEETEGSGRVFICCGLSEFPLQTIPFIDH